MSCACNASSIAHAVQTASMSLSMTPQTPANPFSLSLPPGPALCVRGCPCTPLPPCPSHPRGGGGQGSLASFHKKKHLSVILHRTATVSHQQADFQILWTLVGGGARSLQVPHEGGPCQTDAGKPTPKALPPALNGFPRPTLDNHPEDWKQTKVSYTQGAADSAGWKILSPPPTCPANALSNKHLRSDRIFGGPKYPPPPLVVPHPLSFPRGGWGTVTWSTQNFSLRLIVLLCG